MREVSSNLHFLWLRRLNFGINYGSWNLDMINFEQCECTAVSHDWDTGGIMRAVKIHRRHRANDVKSADAKQRVTPLCSPLLCVSQVHHSASNCTDTRNRRPRQDGHDMSCLFKECREVSVQCLCGAGFGVCSSECGSFFPSSFSLCEDPWRGRPRRRWCRPVSIQPSCRKCGRLAV